MIFVLDATNKSLRFSITAGAGSDVHFTSHWADATTSGLTEGQTQGTSNGSTAVDAVAAPAASTRRVVKLITFHNTNTTLSRTVTLVNDVGGTSRTIAVFTLAPLATWYSDTASTTAIADGDKGDLTVSGSGTTWTIDNGAVTAAKLGGGSQGDILYRGASSWTQLAAGTRGRYLQTAGTGADPSWAMAIAFKNVIINGDMQVAQRATTFTSTGGANNDAAYTLDRWKLFSDDNDVVDITQATDAPGATTGGFTKRINSIGLDVETINKKFGIAQIVERRNCDHLIGGVVSLSFKARVSSTTKLDKIRAGVIAWSGAADTVTSDIISSWNAEDSNPTLIANATFENTPTALNTSTSWTSYAIPNIAIDTANTTNLIVFIWSDVTDTTLGDFLYITDVQLEPGPVATEFEYLPHDLQLFRCQRYYFTNQSASNRYFAGEYQISGGVVVAGVGVDFPTEMRANPTFSVASAGAAAVFSISNRTFYTLTALTLAIASTQNALLEATFNTVQVLAGQAMFMRPGQGQNLQFNAEL